MYGTRTLSTPYPRGTAIGALESGQRAWFASACVMHTRQYVCPESRNETGSSNGSAQMLQEMVSKVRRPSAPWFSNSSTKRWRFVRRAVASAIF